MKIKCTMRLWKWLSIFQTLSPPPSPPVPLWSKPLPSLTSIIFSTLTCSLPPSNSPPILPTKSSFWKTVLSQSLTHVKSHSDSLQRKDHTSYLAYFKRAFKIGPQSLPSSAKPQPLSSYRLQMHCSSAMPFLCCPHGCLLCILFSTAPIPSSQGPLTPTRARICSSSSQVPMALCGPKMSICASLPKQPDSTLRIDTCLTAEPII